MAKGDQGDRHFNIVANSTPSPPTSGRRDRARRAKMIPRPNGTVNSVSVLCRRSFKMDDICGELDMLTLEFFDNLELLQEKREYLNRAIRDGHLNLSKARYSMGNKSVGALQYSHKMDFALYHVEDGCPKEESASTCMFKLQKSLPGKAVEPSKTVVNDNGKDKNVLRRRKSQQPEVIRENSDEISGIEELNLSKEEKLLLDGSSNGSIQDPIKWFGILVPGCLKMGQKNFQSAIELSCEVVNLEANLTEIIEKIQGSKNS